MEDNQCDALLLQNMSGNGAPQVWGAHAIIRKIKTHDTSVPFQWAFHTLTMGCTGSGIYGDIETVRIAAERQFGIKSDIRQWIQVEYLDLPLNLLPMNIA